MRNKDKTMRSVVFDGQPFEIYVRDIPKANVIRQTDTVVRVTSAVICGTNLHNNHTMGIIKQVGADVDLVKVRDRVIIPDFPDGVGLDLEPAINPPITFYRQSDQFSDLRGCQAEFVRVPLAGKSLIVLGEEYDEIADKDLVLLSDIFPTAWSGFEAGDKIAILGAGALPLEPFRSTSQRANRRLR
ncbi:hypothetical protein BDV26DRAFT_278916 [Aspergillus bertholletiae]|uniref:Uncharacterized protein n=1 Tax=Aspergillus bertholletiae TaxID=1226010 RepID=A0A5N7BHV2_9EURO|nr:hypothetical protein BDV26DRAFT_278916 [Aspergillus bertholletiae]